MQSTFLEEMPLVKLIRCVVKQDLTIHVLYTEVSGPEESDYLVILKTKEELQMSSSSLPQVQNS